MGYQKHVPSKHTCMNGAKNDMNADANVTAVNPTGGTPENDGIDNAHSVTIIQPNAAGHVHFNNGEWVSAGVGRKNKMRKDRAQKKPNARHHTRAVNTTKPYARDRHLCPCHAHILLSPINNNRDDVASASIDAVELKARHCGGVDNT